MTTHSETSPTEPRRLDGASVGIPPRHLELTIPEGTGRHPFFDANAVASSLFVVFSSIFPPGERFFIRSVKRFRDRIDDPVLSAKISGFIVQEAFHGRAHEELNAFFASKGVDVETPERMIRAGLALLAKLPPTQQLACTTFMEHFTALLAEKWLTDASFQKTSDPEMLKLWVWHALEELEHKSVAYDVFREVSDSRLERMLAGPLVVATLLPGIALSWAWLVLRDPERLNIREHKRGLRHLLGPRGFVTSLLPKLPVFARAEFHPNRHDTSALEEAWRERLFGREGELLGALRGRTARAHATC
jgi:uncharacterized protein